MKKIAKVLIGIFLIAIIFSLVNIPLDAAWLSGWNYRKEINIQFANVDANLTDFPIYIDITADGDIGTHISDSTDGKDIRFTSDDEVTLLKYEREEFSVAASVATGYYWVKVPSILAASGATIYIYYNDGDGTVDGEDAENVWDGNFKVVHHLKDATTSTILDSTTNDKDGTKEGANEPIEDAAGVIWKCQDSDGSDDYIGMGLPHALGECTMTWWLKTSHSGVYCGIVTFRSSTGLSSIAFNINDSDVPFLYLGVNNYCYFSDASAYFDGNWHHWSLYIKGSGQADIDNAILTIDGNNIAFSSSNKTGAPLGFATGFTLFKSSYGAINADMDEFRSSLGDRGADWIKFELANMNEADAELDWQSEEEAPVTPYVPNRVIVITENNKFK